MLQKAPMTSPSVLGTPQLPPHVRRRGSQRLEASLSYSASLLFFCQPRSQALQAVLFFVLFSSPKPYSDHPQLESLITSMRLYLFPVILENDSLDPSGAQGSDLMACLYSCGPQDRLEGDLI